MSWRDRLTDTRPLRSSVPFRTLWLGTSLGAIGAQVATVAVLLQVWEMTGSPLWTGAIGLATAVPMLVFGLIGGSLADALDRRTVVRFTMAGQVLAACALAVQALARNESVALLLGLVSVLSASGALGAAARRALPVRLLPADQLAAGIALQSMSFQVAMLLGPALGGLLIAQWGFTASYSAQAVLSGAALLATLPLPPMPPKTDGDGAGGEAGEATVVAGKPVRSRPARGGWGVLFRQRLLWGAFSTDLAATLLAMPVALFPLVNEIRFDGDPRTLGLFLTSIAVGGLGAGLLSGTYTRIRRGGVAQLVAAGVWGAALAGFGLAGPLWLALTCLAVAGAADTVSVVARSAMVQLSTPDKYLGRVSSVDHIIGVAGPEVGNFRAGVVASLTSAPFALASGGLSTVAVVALLALVNRPLRTYRADTSAPAPLTPTSAGTAPTGQTGTAAPTPEAAHD